MTLLRTSAFSAAIVLSASTAIQAQDKADMSKFTCQQIASGPIGESVETAIWLSGYYNGLRKNTMLDYRQFKKNAELVIQECAANPKKTVMQVINGTLAAGKKK